MYTLFQGGPIEFSAPGERPQYWAPRFLVELPSWRHVFFGNLRDLLLAPFRHIEPLALTSEPGVFWPDVFVNRRLPAAPFRESLLFHVLLVVAVIAVSQVHWFVPAVAPRNPFQNSKIVYYPVSEYLPPLNEDSASEPAKVEQKGEPVYAPQRIVSLPRHPDNRSQTIITPSPLTIDREVRLPNIVAWSAPVPAVPATGVTSRLTAPALPTPIEPPPEVTRSQLTAPVLTQPAPVEPPPEVTTANKLPNVAPGIVPPAPNIHTSSKLPNVAAPAPVEPPPAVTATNKLRLPALGTAAAVEPAPSADATRRVGDLNIGRLDRKLPSPRLAVAEQRVPNAPAVSAVAGLPSKAGTLGAGPANSRTEAAIAPAVATSSLTGRTGSAALAGRAGTAVAPAVANSAVTGVNGMKSIPGAGQIIALGIHPAPPGGPLEVPEGNRRGTFAAGPEGKPGASGTPDIHGGGTKDGGGGHGNGGNGGGNGKSGDPTAGIMIAAGPVNPGPVAVAGPTSLGAVSPSFRTAMKAALGPSRAADIARQTHAGSTSSKPEPQVHDEIFGPKRFYSMVLNMPNLTSSGGSWIIRFAELKATRDTSELTAPVAVMKVDPAYPTDLMRGRVEGVVVLYAVIRADGTVSEVRVLHGVDERLDTSARDALLKWHFRPATKHGSAVDLEAVVQIPFQAKRSF